MALPFAVVGAAAGWLSAGLLANPLVNLCYRNEQILALGCATVIAGCVGAWLRRRCGPGELFADRSATRVRVVFAVIAGGILSGAAVGAISWANARGAVAGALSGIPCALGFMPVCFLVVGAGQRAARARLGTIVAAADRRAMWGILAIPLASTTLVALPDWPAATEPVRDRPLIALGMALAAAAFLLAMIASDARALARLAGVARAHGAMEPRTAAEVEAEAACEPIPEVDLGLGDEVVARIARGGAAYRATERAVARIVGSPARSLDAMREAIRHKAIGLALVVGVLVLHYAAASPFATLLYHDHRCDDGAARSCSAAAMLLQGGAGLEADLPRAASFHEKACDARWPEAKSCAALAELLEGGLLGAPDTSRAAPLRGKACDAGDAASCRVLAHLIVRSDRPDRDVPRANDLVVRGCARGDAESCREAPVFAAATSWDSGVRPSVIACIDGRPFECEVAAAHFIHGDMVERGARLHERACDLGHTQSCTEAAWALRRTSTDNDARATELYEKACDRGAWFACCEGAWLRVHGEGVIHDRDRARELLRRARDGSVGEAGACGVLLHEGVAPKDLPQQP